MDEALRAPGLKTYLAEEVDTAEMKGRMLADDCFPDQGCKEAIAEEMKGVCAMSEDGQWDVSWVEESGHTAEARHRRAADWTAEGLPAWELGMTFGLQCFAAMGTGTPGTEDWVEMAGLATNEVSITGVQGAAALSAASAALIGYLAM